MSLERVRIGFLPQVDASQPILAREQGLAESEALELGQVDGICVSEPWNRVAVDRGVGRIALVTAQVWRRGVEKVLAMRRDRALEAFDLVHRLIRALHGAAAHFVTPDTGEANAAILARPEYLDAPDDPLTRAITDRVRLVQSAESIHITDFMFQYREAANFPWRSQAAWLYSQMTRWDGTPFSPEEAEITAGVFRPDIYRAALASAN